MVVGALVVLTACSGGGGGSSEASSTSALGTTTTSAAPTTTTVPREQVRLAWDAYWAMKDRLLAAPDPDDPELVLRADEPLLSKLRDDLAQRKADGWVVVVPAGAVHEHSLEQIEVSGTEAVVRGCEHDDSVTLGPTGQKVSGSKVTRILVGTFTFDGSVWKATIMGVVSEDPGIVRCVV
jgi:hypothetical protein